MTVGSTFVSGGGSGLVSGVVVVTAVWCLTFSVFF